MFLSANRQLSKKYGWNQKMKIKKVIPFEVVDKAVAREADATDSVLCHYTGLSTYQGHIYDDIQDRLKAQLIKAVLQFQFNL